MTLWDDVARTQLDTLSLQLKVILRQLTHHQISLQVVTEAATSLTLLLQLMNSPDSPPSTSQHNQDIQVKVFHFLFPRWPVGL